MKSVMSYCPVLLVFSTTLVTWKLPLDSFHHMFASFSRHFMVAFRTINSDVRIAYEISWEEMRFLTRKLDEWKRWTEFPVERLLVKKVDWVSSWASAIGGKKNQVGPSEAVCVSSASKKKDVIGSIPLKDPKVRYILLTPHVIDSCEPHISLT
jgi:hypothetical protein